MGYFCQILTLTKKTDCANQLFFNNIFNVFHRMTSLKISLDQ